MSPALELRLSVAGPLPLADALGARAGRVIATAVVDGDRVWRAVRTPLGPATVRFHRTGDAVHAAMWGTGSPWLAERLGDWLGLPDDPAAVVAHHPLIDRLRRRALLHGRRWSRTHLVVEPLIGVVIGQKVPARDAHRSRQMLRRHLARPAPGPAPAGLVLPPDPDDIASLSTSELHRFGIERSRGERLTRVARHSRRLDAAAELGRDDATRLLTAVRGIGLWSATSVLGAALGDPDIPIVGDYNFPSQVAWALAGERRADDQRMLELLEPYAGQRGRVQQWIAGGSPKPPRRGPRLNVPDIRRM